MTVAPQPTVRPLFPALDTLRAIGAVGVLTTHVAFQSGDYSRHGILGAMLARLDVGVALFFVLSGFLLARPYLAAAALARPRPALGRYYWKRFLRIYPMYAVCVVLALTLLPENSAAGTGQWVRALTMTDLYRVVELPTGLTQMWSLSVEVAFYAVLPMLMWVVLGRGRTLRPTRVVALLVVGTALAIWWNAGLSTDVQEHSSGVPGLWLPGYLTWFLAGIGLALVHVLAESGSSAGPVRWLVELGAMPGVCWSAALGVLLVGATPLGGPVLLLVTTPGQSVFKHLAYAVVAFLVVLPGVFAPREGRFATVLSARPLRHLGHLSYGVFCIHLVVLHVVRELTEHRLFSGEGLALWAWTMLVTVVAAEILYRTVELPAMRLRAVRLRVRRRPPSTSIETQAASTR